MHGTATFVGTKRLVGVASGRVAAAERFEVDGKGAWMIFEDEKPVGVEPSWDAASRRLRSNGFRVHAEARLGRKRS